MSIKPLTRVVIKKLLIILLFIFFIISSYGKNRLIENGRDWKIIKTLHFDIYYPYDMVDIGIYTARIAEESYVYLSNYFTHDLAKVVSIIIFPPGRKYINNNNHLSENPMFGSGSLVNYEKKIYICFSGSYAKYHRIVTHKLTHIFQENILNQEINGIISFQNMSISDSRLWVTDGLAEYLSHGFDEATDMVIRDIFLTNIPENMLNIDNPRCQNSYLSVKIGQAFFFFFETAYGREKVGELLRDIRDTGNFTEAIVINASKTIEELNLEFVEFFQKRYFFIKSKKDYFYYEQRIIPQNKIYFLSNLYPAVSPNAMKIAYIQNNNSESSISIVNLKDAAISRLIDINTNFTDLSDIPSMCNSISWLPHGNILSYIDHSDVRDVIRIIDAASGATIKIIKLPFCNIKDHNISADGNLVVFIGQRNRSSDIYIYNMKENKLLLITNDLFYERYPKISGNNEFIIYSSNENDSGDIELVDNKLYKIDINSKQKQVLVSEGNNIHPDISFNDQMIVYSSNVNGAYDVYIYNLLTRKNYKVSDISNGIFYPQWFPDGKKIACMRFKNYRFDIFTMDISKYEDMEKEQSNTRHYKKIKYDETYFDIKDSVFTEYSKFSNLCFKQNYKGIFWNDGLAGSLNVGLTDILNEHELYFGAEYLRFIQDYFNYNLSYNFFKFRTDIGIGFFLKSIPYNINYFNNENILENHIYKINSSNYYGFNNIISYSFCKFLNIKLKASSIFYQDISDKQNQVSVSIEYDKLFLGNFGKDNNTIAKLIFNHSFKTLHNKRLFNNIDFSLHKLFQFSNIFSLKFQSKYGRIFGEKDSSYKYYLGGFNTVRGHRFSNYSGGNIYIVNTEINVAILQNMRLNWPIILNIYEFGFVIFVDFGSVWEDEYNLRNSDGAFDDLKSGMGTGLRFSLQNHIYFKLDLAWPYFYKSFGDREVIFYFGINY